MYILHFMFYNLYLGGVRDGLSDTGVCRRGGWFRDFLDGWQCGNGRAFRDHTGQVQLLHVLNFKIVEYLFREAETKNRLIVWKKGEEKNSLSLTHSHTQTRSQLHSLSLICTSHVTSTPSLKHCFLSFFFSFPFLFLPFPSLFFSFPSPFSLTRFACR